MSLTNAERSPRSECKLVIPLEDQKSPHAPLTSSEFSRTLRLDSLFLSLFHKASWEKQREKSGLRKVENAR
jgi:hypothetical protein